MATLPLPTHAKTTTFRKIVGYLSNDPVLRNVFGSRIQAYTGKPDDSADLVETSTQPALRLTPACGPMTWWSPDAQVGNLVIGIEAAIPGLDADDILNLQGAIETALYPADPAARNARILELQQATGGQSGLPVFSVPVQDPHPGQRGDENFLAIGQITIAVNRQLNA